MNLQSQVKDFEALTSALRQKQGLDTSGDQEDVLSLSKKSQQKGIHITPQAGFSYKTYVLGDGSTSESKSSLLDTLSHKVFINIVQHEQIDPPAMKKKLDQDGKEVEGLNIPMSVGPERREKDKQGSSCRVFDIIVHPDVVHDARDDSTGKYREFLCQLGIQCVQNKYGLKLDNRYKLPKLVYMGDVEKIPQHYVQDRRNAPRIEEVSKNNAQQAKSSPTVKAKQEKEFAKTPETERDDAMVTMHWVRMKENQDSSIAILSARDRLRMVVRDCIASSTEGETTAGERDCAWEKYLHSTSEYLDPIHSVSLSLSPFIVVSVDFQSYESPEYLLSQLSVSLSPFKAAIKIPGYRLVALSLCCAVDPAATQHFVRSIEGFVSRKRLFVILPVSTELSRLEQDCDPGSKPWLLAHAISTETNPYLALSSQSSQGAPATLSDKSGGDDADGLAEDKFHLRLPRDVDAYTGVPTTPSLTTPNVDDWELPEDKFHRKDASSSFLLSQREQSKKDKWDKYEKERAERKSDPNVEYVDMEDFRPGGKHSSVSAPPQGASQLSTELQPNKDIVKASEVLSEFQNTKLQGLVSSNLWTELLD